MSLERSLDIADKAESLADAEPDPATADRLRRMARSWEIMYKIQLGIATDHERKWLKETAEQILKELDEDISK